MKVTNDISVQEEIELELGPRVFRSLSAENGPGRKFIEGVSEYRMRHDDSGEDWSDVLSMTHDDRQYDFTLIRGIQMMVGLWEIKEDEAARSMSFEEWISEGGMDDTFPEEDWSYAVT